MSMTITHQEKAGEYFKIAERGWGIGSELLRRMGLLVVLWGLFETKLEVAVWRLRDEEVADRRPSTEGKPIGNWIDALGAGSPKLGDQACGVLKGAAQAATDLIQYRHSITHGNMMPSEEMPSFLRNGGLYGEIRRRPPSTAFISENLLDMAIDSAGTLCRVVLATLEAFHSKMNSRPLLVLESDVRRAVSQAAELRDLAAAMNHEKY